MEKANRKAQDSLMIDIICLLPPSDFFIEIKRHAHLLCFKWEEFEFSSKFIEAFTKLNDAQVKKAVIQLLCGNNLKGSSTKWKSESGLLYKHCQASLLEMNVRISYLIYFKRMGRSINNDIAYFEQSLLFMALPTGKEDAASSLKSFIALYSKDNAGLTFDINILSNQSHIDSIKRTEGLAFERSNRTMRQSACEFTNVFGEDNEIVGDESIWDETEDHRIVLERLAQKRSLDYESIIKEETIDCFPSKQEKELINTTENIIVSGRPGTGKTFIVVFKCVLLFYNCHIIHCKLIHNAVNWSLLQEQISRLVLPKEQFKIVVTSLNQILCSKAEEMYSHLINKSNKTIKHYPLSKHTREQLRCFNDVQIYPLFVNFRKILFMVDGNLTRHFFMRKINNQLKKPHEDCDINYYGNCSYHCADDLNKVEINEENFINCPYFVDMIKHDKRLNSKATGGVITPMEVYSQIIAIIKGSSFSYLSKNNGISREQYHKIGRKSAMMNETQRDAVYDVFLAYEKWKGEKHFDIQDFVSHLIREVTQVLVPYQRKLIDFLLIDEVQDFSINQLYLMTLITRDIKIATGDTCQTISKVNRFRFCDLSGIYFALNQINPDIFMPSRIQINLNFRCHSTVIRLSHFFFQLIFLLFPETLDKAKLDYTTQVNNIMPCVIDNASALNALITQGNADKEKDNYNFAFHHCFICYSTETADKLQKDFNHKVLTSTVFDSKGLEYDIVVLYNVFSDQNSRQEWNYLLSQIEFTEIENDLSFLKEQLEQETLSQEQKDLILYEMAKGVKPVFSKYVDESKIHSFFSFCYKLKELYVAMTRARKFLFFYETEQPQIFSVLHEKKLLTYNSEDTIKYAIDFLNRDEQSFEELKKIAYGEYASCHYKKAEYYFDILGNHKMQKQSQIHLLFENILKQSNSINRDTTTFFRTNQSLINLCDDINYCDPECLKGEALLNLKKNEEAYLYFKEKKNLKRCGIVCLRLSRYEEAFTLFNEIEDYAYAVESILALKDFKRLFDYLNEAILDKTDLVNYTQFYAKYSNDFIGQFQYKIDKTKAKAIQGGHKDKKGFSKYSQLIMYYDENKTEGMKAMYSMITLQGSWNLTKERGVGFVMSNRVDEYNKEAFEDALHCSVSNKKIFTKLTKELSVTKTKENEADIMAKYDQLAQFIGTYLSNVHSKLKNKMNEDKQRLLVKLTSNSSSIEESMNEDSDVEIIKHILNDFNANALSKQIIDNRLFRIHLITLILMEIPNLYYHKTKGKGYEVIQSLLNDDNSFVKPNHSNKMFNLVKLSLLIGLNEEETVKLVKKILILHGYFKQVLPLLSKRKLVVFAAMIRKYKLFIFSLQAQAYSFCKPPKDPLFNYIFNSYLSLNLILFFKAVRRVKGNEAYQRLSSIHYRLSDSLCNLRCYPKIYTLLARLITPLNLKDKVKIQIEYLTKCSISLYIRRFLAFLQMKRDTKYTQSQITQLIEEGNTISLSILLYGMKSIDLR